MAAFGTVIVTHFFFKTATPGKDVARKVLGDHQREKTYGL